MKMNNRKKRCVVCGEQFVPQYTTLQRTCDYKCAIVYSKVKEAKNKKELNELRNEKDKKDSLSKMIEYTEKKVHEYVRDRDKGKPCISCARNWDSTFQAGHRYDKKQHHGIRFDLDNIHGQCAQCNQYLGGNYNSYELMLPNRIGKERVDALRKRADICKKVPHTYTRHELREIQENVKKLKKELK